MRTRRQRLPFTADKQPDSLPDFTHVEHRGHSLVVKWAPCKRLLSVRFRLAPPNKSPMIHKLKQQNRRHKFTPSNRLPNRRARLYLVNFLRTVRQYTPSAYLRATMGLLH